MHNNRLDFAVQEAGCLIWVAPRDLGGVAAAHIGQIWMGSAEEETSDLVARGILLPMSLYQDDGYYVRFVVGDLTEQEEAEWTAHVCWKLNVACGQVMVSGCLSEDFEDEVSEIEPAVPGGSYWMGAYVEVPPGDYQVDVYSYPPGDLSAGWGHITDPSLYGKAPGIAPENEMEYFRRTRPEEELPAWLKEGYDETPYVNFIIRLSPLASDLPFPKLEEDGCLAWEFRKPEICPLGMRAEVSEAT